jgi:L(+)-tartrate dehydratase beta subunit
MTIDGEFVTATSNLKSVSLRLPASTDELAALEIGTVVYLTGRIYTAREGVYKKAVEDGAGLPASPEELGFVNSTARRRPPSIRMGARRSAR